MTGDLIADGLLAIGDGYRAKNSELAKDGIPFARGGNINNGFHFEEADCFPEADLHKCGEKISRPGDVVFTSKGTVGRFAFVRSDTPRFVYAPQLCYWRSLDDSVIEPYWLYYWMHGREFDLQASGVKGQTDMADYVSLGDQRRMRITIPPIDEQRAIASVLGSLDDKIELNRRMNRTLEQMAAAIFKAWFVDFEPVRAKASGATSFPGMPQPVFDALPDTFSDSELGPIPEGWEVGRLGDAVEIHDRKRVPLSRRQREERRGPYPYYGATGVFDYVDDFLFDGRFTLIGEDGSVIQENGTPYSQYVWGKIWVNNHAHVLTGLNGWTPELVYLLVRDLYIAPYVTGAVQAKLNQGNMKSIPLVLPPARLLQSCQEQIGPLFDLIRTTSDEIATLGETRDALLPKLLSGETRVAVSRDEEALA